jgi:hypothetical protein
VAYKNYIGCTWPIKTEILLYSSSFSHSEFNQNSVTNSGPKRQVRRTDTTLPEDITVSLRGRNAWEGSSQRVITERHDFFKLRILYVEFINNTVLWHSRKTIFRDRPSIKQCKVFSELFVSRTCKTGNWCLIEAAPWYFNAYD